MQKIKLADYTKIHSDYAGIWTTERWDWDNWEQVKHLYMGKRTMLSYDPKHGTCLLIEGTDFEITE